MSDHEIKNEASNPEAGDDPERAPTSAASTAEPPEGSAEDEPAPAEAPSELELLTAERDKLKDQLLRMAADFDNYRKRSRKDVEQADRRAREDTVREVLPIIDNLERAVEATSTAVDIDAVRDGVRMVLKQFEDVAGRLGLERFSSEGERFDPNLHDAFQQLETDEQPPGTIVKEYQPGYRLGDRLIRPAMVVVARKPAAAAAAAEDEPAS